MELMSTTGFCWLGPFDLHQVVHLCRAPECHGSQVPRTWWDEYFNGTKKLLNDYMNPKRGVLVLHYYYSSTLGVEGRNKT